MDGNLSCAGTLPALPRHSYSTRLSYSIPIFTDTSEECREPHQKTNGTAPKRRGPERDLYMVELILERERTTSHSGARSSPCLTRFLLLAIRNRLVNKLVECCALLGGADGSHDWIPYDVAILIDDIRCREREQI